MVSIKTHKPKQNTSIIDASKHTFSQNTLVNKKQYYNACTRFQNKLKYRTYKLLIVE